MKTPTVTLALAAAVALLAPAPAGAQNREHQQMAADVRMLQEQTQLLSQALNQTLSRLGEIGDAMKKIEARLDTAEATSRKLAADQKATLDGVSSDVRAIRERTQDVNTRIGTLAEEIETLRTSLPAMLAQPPASTDSTLLPGLPPPDGTPALPPSQRSGLTANRLFLEANSSYMAGQYTLAISGFQQLLNEFPRSEQADDAQYYIGSTYLAQKKYPEAVKAFTDVIQNYPKGDKVAEAYLDLGMAQRALGNTDAARTAWQTIMSKFPDSSSAIIAKQRLDGLSQSATPPRP